MDVLICFVALAERQGFEPWEGFPSTVFKTAAFDRSATSPWRNIYEPDEGCNCFFRRFTFRGV